MSGEHSPLLSGTIPAFELFMTHWEKLKEEKPHFAQFIDKGLDSAYNVTGVGLDSEQTWIRCL